MISTTKIRSVGYNGKTRYLMAISRHLVIFIVKVAVILLVFETARKSIVERVTL